MSDDREDGAIGFEGWDTDGTGEAFVRRFAKPPYIWKTFRRDRFDDRVRRRRDDPTLEGETA